jgi:hypothetical protein
MYTALKLEEVDLGAEVSVAANGGSRTFGNTMIAWDPSTTQSEVKVTVSMGGTPIAVKTMTPTDNSMTYNGVSGTDYTKGMIQASFSADGKSGQLNGVLEWLYLGTKGNWTGFIGAW